MYDIDTELQEEDAAKAVSRGYEYLNRHADEGWLEELIDHLDVLDTSLSWDCVLGILCGSYTQGITRLGIEGGTREAERLGFEAVYTDYGHEVLTNAWKEALS